MKFGLDEKVIEGIQQAFQDNWKIDHVILFGSRAKGNYREDSDIDLVVKGKHINFDDILSLSSELDKLNLPYEIDLINYSAIKDEDVIEHIDRVGVIFYEQWKEYFLNEVYKFSSGLSKGREEFGFGFPFLGYTDIFDHYFLPDKLTNLVNSTEKEREICSIKRGDVFLTRTSETDEDLGMSSVSLKDYPNATFNGFTKRLRPTETVKVLPEFAAFYFRSPKFRAAVSGMSSVTTRASLNNGMLSALKIIVPPIKVQTSIAALMYSLCQKIDLLQRQNRTLEQLAETLFRKSFVKEASKDWEIGKVGDVVTVKGGTTPSTTNPEFWNGNVYWTSPRDLTDNASIFLLDTRRKITEEGLAQIGSGLLPVGTVLLSSRAPIGYLAITEIAVAINQGFIAIITDRIVSKYFIYLWCKANMSEIESAGNGSVFQEISKSTFKELEFIIPSKDKLEFFDKEVESMFQKIKSNTRQIKTLITLRDTLLPKLISGEVRKKF